MPEIKKPTFPVMSTEALTRKLDDVNRLVQGATSGGKIDVGALQQAAATSNDALIQEAVDAIVDDFVSYRESGRVSGACGGPIRERVEPQQLDAAEVQKVMQALALAKNRVGQQVGEDGVLQWNEVQSTHKMGSDLAGKLGKAAVQEAAAPYVRSLTEWVQVVEQTAYKVEARQEIESRIDSLASHHAKSKDGQAAIREALRAVATHPERRFNFASEEKALMDAETSFLSRLPLFGTGANMREGHLSDGEVRALFKIDDLGAFAQKKSEEVKGQVGDYAAYLQGKDLPNWQSVSDPDVQQKLNSRC